MGYTRPDTFAAGRSRAFDAGAAPYRDQPFQSSRERADLKRIAEALAVQAGAAENHWPFFLCEAQDLARYTERLYDV